jgi:hypothetical protein
MEAIELGNPMPIKQGEKMLKFPLNPRVYVVEVGEVIRHIPDEETAAYLYGESWNQQIIELPEIYFLFYTKSSALESKKAEYLHQKASNSISVVVPTVTPSYAEDGCFYNMDTCGPTETCLNNQCVVTAPFLPSNMHSSVPCENDEVYRNGQCEKAGLVLAYHSQLISEAQLNKVIDDALVGLVSAADLGSCKEKIRVHIVHGLCLDTEVNVGEYFEKNYKTNNPVMIRPGNGGDPNCSHYNSGYVQYGTYIDGGAGTIVHELGHALGLWDQYCYYPSGTSPNPVNFTEAECVPSEGWYLDYCNRLPSDGLNGQKEGSEITPYTCLGNKNEFGGVTIMGGGEGGELISESKFRFTEQEISVIKNKLGC